MEKIHSKALPCRLDDGMICGIYVLHSYTVDVRMTFMNIHMDTEHSLRWNDHVIRVSCEEHPYVSKQVRFITIQRVTGFITRHNYIHNS